ncbi:MAG: hypothetical protein D6732_28490, partial [Methanobacteriota archaeon]
PDSSQKLIPKWIKKKKHSKLNEAIHDITPILPIATIALIFLTVNDNQEPRHEPDVFGVDPK